jgi:polyketide biosynthesis 3-hydroxy-3-methylglutaryl-CoA synthase-like enzyme PksG
VGLFSYGSGCASEFFSGVVTPGVGLGVSEALARRYRLTVEEYDRLTSGLHRRGFGVKEAEFDPAEWNPVYDAALAGRGLLVLDRIKDFHREYRWT